MEKDKKNTTNWRSKRDNFLKIIKDNLPSDRIKEELGDIQKGWDSDIVGELLTEEDKQKLKTYEKLVEKEELQPEVKKDKLFTFTCDICDQNKQHQKLHRFRINGIGFSPNKYQKICDYCIDRVDWIKEKEDDFF